MNDNQSPALRATLDAVAAAPGLRLVWSNSLHPVGKFTPWERLRDLWLWSGYVEWLRQDLHSEP